MKSQTKDSLMLQTDPKSFSVATVLSINFEDEKFAKCVQMGLKKDLSKITFVPGDKFRDALYPWFEPSTAPKEIDELSAILNKVSVRKRIKALGVELLIYVYGDTYQDRLQGYGGGGYPGAAVGYGAAERQTRIWTTVWDLKEKAILGTTDVNFQGTVHVPVLGIPIVIPAFTESSACSETVKRISNGLTGRGSEKAKGDN